jgi:hypothetical protein
MIHEFNLGGRPARRMMMDDDFGVVVPEQRMDRQMNRARDLRLRIRETVARQHRNEGHRHEAGRLVEEVEHEERAVAAQAVAVAGLGREREAAFDDIRRMEWAGEGRNATRRRLDDPHAGLAEDVVDRLEGRALLRAQHIEGDRATAANGNISNNDDSDTDDGVSDMFI